MKIGELIILRDSPETAHDPQQVMGKKNDFSVNLDQRKGGRG